VVHVLSTGDELVEPVAVPRGHELRNSNAPALAAQLAELGLAARYLGIAGDRREELGRQVQRGLDGDVLLVTGGVSAGAYDLVRASLATTAFEPAFHGVAVRPGQPLLVGTCGACLVFGLPGNPLSTFTTFAVFVAPALRRLLGYRSWSSRRLPARLTERLVGRPGRETYHLACLKSTARGLVAHRVASMGSGDVLALARADGFIVTPAQGGSYAPGATVETLAWP
jgi:molybdopterin molybdotransferase